jgi:uncharacterized circularly permuted ATP-grasp superfamily protein
MGEIGAISRRRVWEWRRRVTERPARQAQQDLLDCTRGYTALPGIPDEFLDAKGQPREVWARFFDAFSTLAPERSNAALHLRTCMREAGVTYRTPGDAADRMWPLSHLPLLIGEAEWKQISEGVAQRAELFEQILRDLYGEGRLIADGALPAAAIAEASNICGRSAECLARWPLPQPLCC